MGNLLPAPGGACRVRPAPARPLRRPDRSANACGVRVTAYVAKYIWRTDPSSPRTTSSSSPRSRPWTARNRSARLALEARLPQPAGAGQASPQLVVAHLQDELLALGPPAAEELGEVGLRLRGRPRLGEGRLGVEHRRHQLRRERDRLGAGRAVAEHHGADPVGAADPQAGEEARHGAAVPGQHPLPDALQVEAQPVGAAPAVDVGHDQRPAHLLDRVGAEHLGHRVGDEAGVAAQVGDGAPEAAQRRRWRAGRTAARA